MSDQTELLRLLRLAWGTDHVSAEDCKKIDTLLATPPEDVRAVVDEPVQIVAVAVTHKDDNERLRLNWLLEGGISELEFAGTVLFAMPKANDLCDEDGSAEVYLHLPRQVVTPEKYDEVLLPFLKLMRAELHANSHKGDRPGWLEMSADQCMLELYYHQAKLHYALRHNDMKGLAEFAADTANLCVMLLDICGILDLTRREAEDERNN